MNPDPKFLVTKVTPETETMLGVLERKNIKPTY